MAPCPETSPPNTGDMRSQQQGWTAAVLSLDEPSVPHVPMITGSGTGLPDGFRRWLDWPRIPRRRLPGKCARAPGSAMIETPSFRPERKAVSEHPSPQIFYAPAATASQSPYLARTDLILSHFEARLQRSGTKAHKRQNSPAAPVCPPSKPRAVLTIVKVCLPVSHKNYHVHDGSIA